MKYARFITNIEWERRQRTNFTGSTNRVALEMLGVRDIERYLSKVSIGRDEECWLYSSTSKSNYPRFKGLLCHRISYEVFNGSIGHGMTIDHLCMIRWCQNPYHLEAVTVQENSKRYRDYQMGLA